MAEQVADGAEWCAFLFECDGVGEPECMCVDAFVDVGELREAWEQVADIRLIHLATLEGAKQRRRAVADARSADADPARLSSAADQAFRGAVVSIDKAKPTSVYAARPAILSASKARALVT